VKYYVVASLFAFACDSLGSKLEKGTIQKFQGTPSLSAEQKADFNARRETHIIEKTLDAAGDADRILVICGRSHTANLAAEFRSRGHDVTETDVLDEPWYVEDWFTHIMSL
jgi:hypothetical protein